MKNAFIFLLQYKHSGTFANRKYEELSYPKDQKMCDPILVTLFQMRPHDSQSSRENATPSSGTSPLVSYKEVPTPREMSPAQTIKTEWTTEKLGAKWMQSKRTPDHNSTEQTDRWSKEQTDCRLPNI